MILGLPVQGSHHLTYIYIFLPPPPKALSSVHPRSYFIHSDTGELLYSGHCLVTRYIRMSKTRFLPQELPDECQGAHSVFTKWHEQSCQQGPERKTSDSGPGASGTTAGVRRRESGTGRVRKDFLKRVKGQVGRPSSEVHGGARARGQRCAAPWKKHQVF